MFDSEIINRLKSEELIISGRLIDASNATLLGNLKDEEDFKIIYKPVAGERPLWDFPDGSLAAREYAAYLFSEIFEFHLVPETVLREGPFGFGMVQRWINEAQSENLIEIAQGDCADIRRMIFFDALINNADRKYGHILIGDNDQILGCDHGISFHVEDKLRTVLWQYSGDDLNGEETSLLRKVLDYKFDEFNDLLTKDEIKAIGERALNLLNIGRLPTPAVDRPAIPWPPV
jgi:hypothetical protein